MSKTLAVIRREFVERVRTRAFIISTLLLPIFIVVMAVAPALLMRSGDRTTRVAVVDGSSAGLGAIIAQQLHQEKLGSSETARYEVTLFPATNQVDVVRKRLIGETGFASKAGTKSWDGVLVVSDASLTDGSLEYLGNNVGSVDSMRQLQNSLTRILTTVRLGKSGIDAALVSRALSAAQLKTTKVTEGKLTDQSGEASFLISYLMGFMLYMSIVIYGQQTMSSVIEEKTSRIMEVLVSSLTPFQMLLGKVIGVGMAGLAQMSIWGGTVFLITSQRVRLAGLFGVSAESLQSFPIPTMAPDLLVIFLLYFALGFLLYGALYAAIGAMCNTAQETQQYAVLVTVLIMIGFMSVFALIKDPTGGIGVTLSFIPFFAPFLMPVRWSLASVPLGELGLSLLFMAVALLACVWIAARIYRTGILMFGKKPSWSELYRWVRDA